MIGACFFVGVGAEHFLRVVDHAWFRIFLQLSELSIAFTKLCYVFESQFQPFSLDAGRGCFEVSVVS